VLSYTSARYRPGVDLKIVGASTAGGVTITCFYFSASTIGNKGAQIVGLSATTATAAGAGGLFPFTITRKPAPASLPSSKIYLQSSAGGFLIIQL
jgi:hypothetical protein